MRSEGLLARCFITLVALALLGGVPRLTLAETTLREAVEELRQVYSADIMLGTPLLVDGMQIIPLASVSMAYGQRQIAGEQPQIRGAGGVLSPVGVLVLSRRGVQFFPIAKGTVEQMLSAFMPVIWQQFMPSTAAAQRWKVSQERVSIPNFLAALAALLPNQSWQFGLFPWPLGLVVVFVVGWVALAVLLVLFAPGLTHTVATTLQEGYLWAGGIGLLGIGGVLFLAVLLAVSVIGLPVTVALLIGLWVSTLFGMVSIAWLLGRQMASTVPQRYATDVVYVLLGGILLGVLRVIPVLGWITWGLLGLCSFGAVLRTLRRLARREVAPV